MASIINATTTNGVAVQGDNSGSLQLQTNNGTTAVTIDTSQNVGVGTTSPSQKLDVTGNARLNASSSPVLQLSESGTLRGSITGSSTIGLYFQTFTTTPMRFDTNGLERMRIASDGNVGIGITPYATASRTVLSVVTGSLVYEPSISNGNSSGVFNNFANIGGSDKNVVTGYSQGMVFNNDGSGQVLMLTTSASTSAGGGISFTAGPYLARGGTSWTSNSDERLKNITGEISNGLDKVCSLRAAEFTWKDDESAKPCVGLIAQDVQAVLPEVITTTKKYNSEDETEYLGISYTDIIPLLVASIKELKAELDATKAEVQALKGVA